MFCSIPFVPSLTSSSSFTCRRHPKPSALDVFGHLLASPLKVGLNITQRFKRSGSTRTLNFLTFSYRTSLTVCESSRWFSHISTLRRWGEPPPSRSFSNAHTSFQSLVTWFWLIFVKDGGCVIDRRRLDVSLSRLQPPLTLNHMKGNTWWMRGSIDWWTCGVAQYCRDLSLGTRTFQCVWHAEAGGETWKSKTVFVFTQCTEIVRFLFLCVKILEICLSGPLSHVCFPSLHLIVNSYFPGM